MFGECRETGKSRQELMVAWVQEVTKEMRENAKEVLDLSQTCTELRLEPRL